ncbi:MAG: ABC transporter ATP-binding protein [Flavisolibacter sp.]
MSETVIKIEEVGKLYRLGEIGTGTLSHDLNRWYARIMGKEDPFSVVGETNDRTTRSDNEYVWALKDISFEVKQGQVLGIIGRNGAGKSTLLKILSKVTTPTTGKIKLRGRIASLLEVGTGFHPELTGRENIFLNGAILGMTKTEIKSKFDEIVDFAGVERYIETPVKRYSSGMYVRLAFAVAAFLEPEILIIDEVLAVGDAEFQKKCLGRMKDVSRNDGRTVLFVSHNMGAISNLCDSALLMQYGKIIDEGNVDHVIANYNKFNFNSESEITFEDEVIRRLEAYQRGDEIFIKAVYSHDTLIRQPNLGFVIHNELGDPITGANPIKLGIIEFGEPKKSGEILIKVKSPKLVDGSYTISIWFNDGKGDTLFHKSNCLSVTVNNMAQYIDRSVKDEGIVVPECEWEFGH